MSVFDNHERYGNVSRFFHWGMTLLLSVQFLTAIARFLFEDSWLDELMWGIHKPLGFLLLLFVILRFAWALINLSRRPASVSKAALIGHKALYVLMLVIPALAMMRQYGSGKAFSPLGLPLMDGFDTGKIDWMVGLGNLLHGELGWLLFAFVIGHVVMTVWHRIRQNPVDVMARMWR
ncbi:cytochrome b [Photobacterium galatheae]|uniref:Cytochrome B561 n=1 Tax=Photobacterium galatheae TaxID=1654360 RepID=A0A066RJD3_9GAMM|nr:cytochrome b/b6 domain-containing protein [Photobacterium galatheae]KDM90545.1 cytochrome B561 [Photobacterium galatheae]MCM0148067.1 cytochrome b [Photobacterium galatheae]